MLDVSGVVITYSFTSSSVYLVFPTTYTLSTRNKKKNASRASSTMAATAPAVIIFPSFVSSIFLNLFFILPPVPLF